VRVKPISSFGTNCDRTIIKMRGSSPQDRLRDFRQSENAQTLKPSVQKDDLNDN
jgi:hypothetical protein